ncbi:hypothetical protein, partial [Longibacter sp.]|uniref:hypothetical protein n=1 Tax=Longibacter sp. TaxID=2045415 RepID=UPI003EBB0E23
MKRRLPTSSRSGLLSIGRDTRINLMLGLLLLIAAAGVVGLIHVGQIRLAIAGVILGIIMSLSM